MDPAIRTEIADLQPLREAAVHCHTDELCPTKRRQRSHAMGDRESAERDLGITLTTEQTATRITRPIQRSACDVWRRDQQKRPLRSGGTNVDAAPTPGCIPRIGCWRTRSTRPEFKATRAKLAEHPIEQIGAKLRDMMPWIKQRALVDKSKN